MVFRLIAGVFERYAISSYFMLRNREGGIEKEREKERERETYSSITINYKYDIL